MNTNSKTKIFPWLKIGVTLVVISYILWAPILLFLSLAIGAKTWFWCRLAGIIYGISWVLFIAGFIIAGSDAIRLGRSWILKKLKKKDSSDLSNVPKESHVPAAQSGRGRRIKAAAGDEELRQRQETKAVIAILKWCRLRSQTLLPAAPPA